MAEGAEGKLLNHLQFIMSVTWCILMHPLIWCRIFSKTNANILFTFISNEQFVSFGVLYVMVTMHRLLENLFR